MNIVSSNPDLTSISLFLRVCFPMFTIQGILQHIRDDVIVELEETIQTLRIDACNFHYTSNEDLHKIKTLQLINNKLLKKYPTSWYTSKLTEPMSAKQT